jgi:hypothetical protein
MERIVEWELFKLCWCSDYGNFVLCVRSTGCIVCGMRHIQLIYININTDGWVIEHGLFIVVGLISSMAFPSCFFFLGGLCLCFRLEWPLECMVSTHVYSQMTFQHG